jgi:hypothetical protein
MDLARLHVLQSALREGTNPLCIDVVDQSAHGVLRSSNSSYLRPLPREDIEAMAQLVKELAGLDPSARRAQSGTFHLQDDTFTVNCCPQFDGEILVVYRNEDYLKVLPMTTEKKDVWPDRPDRGPDSIYRRMLPAPCDGDTNHDWWVNKWGDSECKVCLKKVPANRTP